MSKDDPTIQSGTVMFNTVKAGCGIRFDPGMLDEESGFDFSDAQKHVNEERSNSDAKEPADSLSHKS